LLIREVLAMRALAIAVTFVVTVGVSSLIIVGFGMGDTLQGAIDRDNQAQTHSATTVQSAESADAQEKNVKRLPTYLPTRDELGLPPPKPCPTCKNKHRK
jgi:hypothetical protein